MKQGILASALLLASAGFASADYVIIVANVGGDKELSTPGAGMAGMAGMGGMRGGMAGMAGMAGMGGMAGMAGMAGMRGGMAGMAGMVGMAGGPPPGMGGMAGGPPAGMGGAPGGQMRGVPPGMAGMAGGPPGMGGMAGMAGGPPGMGGMPGMAGMAGGPPGMGGMAGMAGGKGMMGGFMGMMGGGGGNFSLDDVPQFVIAVVEVKPKTGKLPKLFKEEKPATVILPKRLGDTCKLIQKPSFGEVFIITEPGAADKSIPTVNETFLAKMGEIKDGSPAIDVVRLAEWTLAHGLVEKFPAVMDKLIAVDKNHPAVIAYLKLKPQLERKLSDDPAIASWRGKLLPGYSTAESPHYLIFHNVAKETDSALATHRNHLENTFHGFYYWFALKGVSLPLPTYRQIIVLTREPKHFDDLHKVLSTPPVVVDGFFSRRENLTVMSSRRQDETYEALTTFWEPWKAKGYQRHELLVAGKRSNNGVPPGMEGEVQRNIEAQMLALMLSALEQEAELATVSHEATRQLLFAAGLLPRNVAVPEWIMFGVGSFFETPMQSPWPTIGAPSPYYLPRWRETKDKGYEKDRVETLIKVVTDAYFRSLPPEGKANSPEHTAREAALRKARTAAWSLTYYLVQEKREGLRRYFAELSKMPRDIELDDTVLLECFARSFGCVGDNNKVDKSKLENLARSWYAYWRDVSFESEGTMKEIRDKIAEHVKKAREAAEKANSGGGTVPGGFGPGGPGGMGPGGFGPGGMGPGGFGPGGPGGMGPGGPGVPGFPGGGRGGRGGGGGGGKVPPRRR
jgi:hypothetical protein